MHFPYNWNPRKKGMGSVSQHRQEPLCVQWCLWPLDLSPFPASLPLGWCKAGIRTSSGNLVHTGLQGQQCGLRSVHQAPSPVRAEREFSPVVPGAFSRWWCSVALSCPTLCNPTDCSTPGLPVHHQLLELAQTRVWIESMMPSNHLILSRLLLLLPSVFFSISVFSNESVLRIRWPKYWSFSNSPSNEYSRLISFRDGLVWSPCCPRDSWVFSNITVQKHQFFCAQPSLLFSCHIHTWLLLKP